MWAVRNILKGTLKFTDVSLEGKPLKLKSRSYFDLDKIDGGRPAALSSEQIQRCFNDGYLQLIHRTQDPADAAGIVLPQENDAESTTVESLRQHINESGDAVKQMLQQVVLESQKQRKGGASDEISDIKENIGELMKKLEENKSGAPGNELEELKKLLHKRESENLEAQRLAIEKTRLEQAAKDEEIIQRQRKELDVMMQQMQQQQQLLVDQHKNELLQMQSVQSRQIEMLTQTIMNLAESTQASNQNVNSLKDAIEQSARVSLNRDTRQKKMNKVDIDAALIMANTIENQIKGSGKTFGNQTRSKVDTNNVADLLSQTDLELD